MSESLKLISFDIEIYNELFEEGSEEVQFEKIIPSVAATTIDGVDIKFYYDDPYITKEKACVLVEDMLQSYKQGYIPFTWNGTSFDFRILGLYSGMVSECADLALNSYDAMLNVTFLKGYFLGLDTALKGFGLASKQHTVTINSGETITDMTGMKAPEMWRNHEFEAVKQYLAGDVIQPLKLAFSINESKSIKWTSKTGTPMSIKTDLIPVKELFKLPHPNTSWMTKPCKKRSEFVDWMPKNILEKNGLKGIL